LVDVSGFPEAPAPPRLIWLFDVSRPGFAAHASCDNPGATCQPVPADSITILSVDARTATVLGLNSINPDTVTPSPTTLQSATAPS
jgi:hypothetical protein